MRAAFYVQDQGSQLIPLAWLKALRQEDGKPFLDAAFTRYGFLRNPAPANAEALPIGFSLADSQQGPMVGMTCAACHTRDIIVDTKTYRIDGGPAFADFQSFVVDLDTAMLRALATEQAFTSFAGIVLGPDAHADAIAALHDATAQWSLRFHTIVSRSIPATKPWGPARLDAIAMIYNRLNGLDLGPPPNYLLPDNMALADAPARYPFLWNVWRQDKTQWGGWAGNGNDALALARNLGQAIGVFASFHPLPKNAATRLDRDYLSANSANIAGLSIAEASLTQLKPPVWPFAVDQALADRGRAVFDRATGNGGCVDCHGIKEGEPQPPNMHLWKTTVSDAGTDLHQWEIVLRSAKSGTLEGAVIPGVVGPLGATDRSLNILKAVVTGTLFEVQAPRGASQAPMPQQGAAVPSAAAMASMPMMTHANMQQTMQVPEMMEAPSQQTPPPGTFVYEARVLQGIWAAAPYLHNGSVASLAELLKPAAQRSTQIKIGPVYDTKTVGLAADQPGAFTLTTTGCEDRNSGNSHCGHDYGTEMPDDEKAALLEYLKTL